VFWFNFGFFSNSSVQIFRRARFPLLPSWRSRFCRSRCAALLRIFSFLGLIAEQLPKLAVLRWNVLPKIDVIISWVLISFDIIYYILYSSAYANFSIVRDSFWFHIFRFKTLGLTNERTIRQLFFSGATWTPKKKRDPPVVVQYPPKYSFVNVRVERLFTGLPESRGDLVILRSSFPWMHSFSNVFRVYQSLFFHAYWVNTFRVLTVSIEHTDL